MTTKKAIENRVGEGLKKYKVNSTIAWMICESIKEYFTEKKAEREGFDFEIFKVPSIYTRSMLKEQAKLENKLLDCGSNLTWIVTISPERKKFYVLIAM